MNATGIEAMPDSIELFKLWSSRMIGSRIREQLVEDCELLVDNCPFPDGTAGPRLFLTVVFKEPPVDNVSPEHNLLQRVFSEVPKYASSPALTVEQALTIMAGKADPPSWYLEDEARNTTNEEMPML